MSMSQGKLEVVKQEMARENIDILGIRDTSGGQSIGVSISSSSEYSGLISFRIDWFDLFAVQRTLKSSPTPQFKSINSSVLSLLYGPALMSIYDYWRIIALTIQTLLAK